MAENQLENKHLNMSKILVALDGLESDRAFEIAKTLQGKVAGFKIHDFIDTYGLEACRRLQEYGETMIDLKLHDIPNTMRHRAKVYEGFTYLTLHASNSIDALKAVREALPNTTLLGVTVLTSISEQECLSIYNKTVKDMVYVLAERALRVGLDGLVCSPLEVKEITESYPELKLVVPGIQSITKESSDQVRVSTPKKAVADGAYRVVIGREIVLSKDMTETVERINRKINLVS